MTTFACIEYGQASIHYGLVRPKHFAASVAGELEVEGGVEAASLMRWERHAGDGDNPHNSNHTVEERRRGFGTKLLETV